jgi:bacteriochlorophyllide a dehydrogenase
MITGRYGVARDRYPFVYGYLRVGIVEAIGADVTRVQEGERVFVGLSGTRLDPQDGLGESGGAHTSVGVAHESDVCPLPMSVKMEDAALLGLAAVSSVGVRLSGVREKELVTVIGQGMIGQMAAQLCRARNAFVVATDIIDRRLQLAARWSSDVVVHGGLERLEHVVQRARVNLGDPWKYGPKDEAPSAYEKFRWFDVDGGADVVIDTVGDSALIPRWGGLLRREGRLCLQGYVPEAMKIDYHTLHRRRATIVFPGGFDLRDYRESLALLEDGRLAIGPLITHTIPAERAVDAFRLLLEEPEQILGMVLDWRGAQ